MAIRAYAAGLNVDLVKAEKYIEDAAGKMALSYDRDRILTIRDNCMESLVNVRKGPRR